MLRARVIQRQRTRFDVVLCDGQRELVLVKDWTVRGNANLQAYAINAGLGMRVSTRPRERDIASQLRRRFPGVLEGVCAAHRLEEVRVLGRDRTATVVAARRELIWRLYAGHGASSLLVGRLLGLDHSTVLHHVRLHRGSGREAA